MASFCQLLQRRYQGQLDERADQYIAFAVNGAQRMQRLINDLLAFSRIGRSTIGFTEVDLDRLVDDAVGQLDGTLDQAEAEVTWSDLPTVRGEEPLLATLLANLIGNSVKFRRPDDGPADAHLCASRVDGDVGDQPAATTASASSRSTPRRCSSSSSASTRGTPTPAPASGSPSPRRSWSTTVARSG